MFVCFFLISVKLSWRRNQTHHKVFLVAVLEPLIIMFSSLCRKLLLNWSEINFDPQLLSPPILQKKTHLLIKSVTTNMLRAMYF